MRVLAVSGPLRRDSHNTRLLRAAANDDHALRDAELGHALGIVVGGVINLARERSEPARQAA